jgi:small conductance mechanosensitive channel
VPLAILAQTDPLVEACGPPGDATYVCRRVFEWTENEFLAEAADFAVTKPLRILVILLTAYLVVRLARRVVRRFVEHAKDDGFQQRVAGVRRRTGLSLLDTGAVAGPRRAQRADAIGNVLRSLTTSVVALIATLMVLGEIGLNLGPLIAGAGIAGIAIGFGAQTLVRDFISGFFMLVEDQYGLGDVIEVEGVSGTVESISLRATRIRDVTGTLWHVPNGTMTKVGNKSQEWARALLDIEVAYSTDIDHARTVIQRVANGMWEDPEYHRQIILEGPEIWGVETLGAHGVAIRLVVKTKPLEQWAVQRELRQRIKAAFDNEGIEIPFPQQVVWWRSDDGPEPEPGGTPEPDPGGTPEP